MEGVLVRGADRGIPVPEGSGSLRVIGPSGSAGNGHGHRRVVVRFLFSLLNRLLDAGARRWYQVFYSYSVACRQHSYLGGVMYGVAT